MKYSITQFGKKLKKSKYTIDEETRTFSTNEYDLVLDFSELDGWTFKTGDNCTFKTGSNCIFKTGYCCTFNTDSWCYFNTQWNCTFTTRDRCTFDTGNNCIFITNSYCTFDTGPWCTFTTGSHCNFKTGSKCIFTTEEECAIVRRDIFEVIHVPQGTKIQLNEYKVKGYTELPKIKTITIDGKDIEISEDSFNELKKQLT